MLKTSDVSPLCTSMHQEIMVSIIQHLGPALKKEASCVSNVLDSLHASDGTSLVQALDWSTSQISSSCPY